MQTEDLYISHSRTLNTSNHNRIWNLLSFLLNLNELIECIYHDHCICLQSIELSQGDTQYVYFTDLHLGSNQLHTIRMWVPCKDDYKDISYSLPLQLHLGCILFSSLTQLVWYNIWSQCLLVWIVLLTIQVWNTTHELCFSIGHDSC